ncbi:MAG: chemotaxis protein CheW [Gammaproteobacteria bacterium]
MLVAETQDQASQSSILNAIQLGNSSPGVTIGIDSDTSRYGFRIGNLGFLFPKSCPGEVLIAPEICPIPNTRDWMPGVISLRGSLIPVFDLHGLLFNTSIIDNKPIILVLDQGKRAFGFVLKDSPVWLTDLVEAPLESSSVPDLIAKLVSKVYLHQETTWLAFSRTDLFTFLGENAKSC